MLTVMGMNADPITSSRALQIAQEYMVPGYTMSVQLEGEAKARTPLTSSSAPYYIISRGANQGYVIVAGDDCLPEILGYTEQGDFDEQNIPEGLQDMLDAWTATIEQAQANGTNGAMAAARKAQRRASKRTDIAPFVTAHWHQDTPYNDMCPTRTDNGARSMTGCVATAAAQILYYWRKDLPATIQATTPTYWAKDTWNCHADVTVSIPKGTPMKWELMLDKYGSEPSDFKEAVAQLVYATGTASRLSYSNDDGTATSGHIEDIPNTYSTYFGMNGGTVHYRDSYSQEAWTQLLYDELAAGRPVMYTGVHESNGGHAVFIHGYKANKDLFYFNFGWGGTSDGYYTTTTTDGMNGFHDSQSALIGACPKTWNMNVDIITPTHVYANIENPFTVKIENNSTLPLSGIYLFASTSSTKPNSLTAAKSSDTETIIPIGGTAEITLTAKPTSSKEWYITVTDKALNVLAKISVTPEKATSDLHLQGLSIDSSSDTETFNGEPFQIIYHNKSAAYATIANHSSIGYEGNMRMYFYEYDEATKEWAEIGYKLGKLTLQGNDEATATFNITSTASCTFETGKHYLAKLANPVPLTDDAIDETSATNTTLRFILKEGDMEVVDFQDGCLTLKGHFDQTAFNSTTFAAKNAYKTATLYDLTQCSSVNIVSQAVNPNALIYVADDSEATEQNVVRAGQCTHLSLTPGYSFTPRAPFHAAHATITLGTEPAQWYLLTVPFTVSVPDGIIAREITAHSITGIANKTIDVTTLEAGKTYLIMTSSTRNVTLTAENVEVLSAPVINLDPAVVGTFVNTTTPANSQLLNDAESQYFEPAAEGTAVEALRGYWQADDLTTTFRAYSALTTDPAYLVLAQAIEDAYTILDKYHARVTTDAYNTYLAEIQAAESAFSHRDDTELTTASKIKNYAAQLLADGDTYMKALAKTEGVEIDCTDHIVNPSFESKTTKGWTVGKLEGYTSVGGVYEGTSPNNYRSVGLDGDYIFQSLIVKADSASVSLSQVVEGLTPGHYRLTAMLGTDETSTVTLYAGDQQTTVSGHPFGHLYLTQAVIDDILVTAPEGADTATLEIGVKDGRWYKADHFTLTLTAPLYDEDPDAIISISGDIPKNVKVKIYEFTNL